MTVEFDVIDWQVLLFDGGPHPPWLRATPTAQIARRMVLNSLPSSDAASWRLFLSRQFLRRRLQL